MNGIASVGKGLFAKYSAALAFEDYRNMWMANLSAQTAAW